MKDQYFTQDNLSDTEFEKWMENQLKMSMVEPPVNFTDAVMERVEKPVVEQQNDATILFVAAGIIALGSCAVTLSTIFPKIWKNILQYLTLSFWSNTSSIIHVVSAIALLCVLFFGLDWLLSQRFKQRNISIA
jgi:hypothetical protein